VPSLSTQVGEAVVSATTNRYACATIRPSGDSGIRIHSAAMTLRCLSLALSTWCMMGNSTWSDRPYADWMCDRGWSCSFAVFRPLPPARADYYPDKNRRPSEHVQWVWSIRNGYRPTFLA
jgi:hypothetical protein